MRYIGLLAFSMVGCFNPQVGSPGFYCHAEDIPACPDGQSCVNGRCVAPGYKPPVEAVDMGDPGVGSGGGDQDMAQGPGPGPGPGPVDMKMPPSIQPDLSQPSTSGKTGCLGELMCENNCTGANPQPCFDACAANATPAGDSLFNALLNCVASACPGTLSTDPCYNSTSTKCTNCLNTCQSAGGQCASAQMACANSTP
jgi:hypothetical protein